MAEGAYVAYCALSPEAIAEAQSELSADGSIAYGTMKAAIIHHTQGLVYQLAAQGVRANTVSPGNTYFPGGVWSSIEQNNPQLFETALGLNPTGRMATPQEVANAVVFLSSPAASFVTGTNLLVDGGLTRGVQF